MAAVQAMRHILGKEQRDEVTKAITAILFERQEIVFAFVHGSFLSGSVFRDIDIGIFVEGIERADFWDYEVEIALKIEETLSRRFLVEPKVINTAPLSFCYHVIRGQLLFSRDEEFLVEFMVRVARSYLEMAPIRHRYIAEAMG